MNRSMVDADEAVHAAKSQRFFSKWNKLFQPAKVVPFRRQRADVEFANAIRARFTVTRW